MITEPGLVYDLAAEEYHADAYEGGSLSHSGAKTLIQKTPAHFAWEREHGRPNTATFDFGHAAHRQVLGDGLDMVVVQKVTKDKTKVDADDYKTKSSQDHADEIRAAGAIPVLARELATVNEMAAALRKHPLASKLLAPGSGRAEVSAFAVDERTGVTMRCRYDWLRDTVNDRLILPDYKTCVVAEQDAFFKKADNYGYPLQAIWYPAVAKALGLAERVEFVFVAQEKTAPYLVNVIQPDHNAKHVGLVQMRKALALYRECTTTGRWPGYGSDDRAVIASLPVWVERAYEGELAS